jgi:Ni/Co efflux regulator RcnB
MKTLLTGALALSIIASAGVASAQPQRNDHDRRDDRQDARRETARPNGPGAGVSKRYSAGRYAPPKGFRADHRWGRGERLPQAYRGRNYVVDHRRYGLSAPPRGYEYVRVGNDVVLTAVATGVIASVVANLFQ